MIGTIKFSSRTQYGRNKRNVPYYLFQSINNDYYIVASKLKTKIDNYAIIDILNNETKPKKGCVKQIIGSINEYKNTKSYILHKYNILPRNKLEFNFNSNKSDLINEHFTYSIDPEGSKDIDDAFSYNGNELIIHITDLTSIDVDINKLMCITSTFYDKDGNYNMFPEDISEDKYSLLENQERNVISLYLNLENNSYKICKRRIKVNKNLSYNEADKLFDSEWLEFKNKIQKNIGFFNDSHEFIEKIMILYNTKFSQFLYEQNKDYPIRIHEGIKLDNLFESKLIDDKLKKRICYHSAVYKSIKSNYTFHKALEIDKYTHTTSPIRRFIDFINQRICFNNLEVNIDEICKIVNNKSYEIKRAYNEIKLLDLSVQLKNEDRIFEAIILDFSENNVKVYIKDLDIIQYVEIINCKIANILNFNKEGNNYIFSNPRKNKTIKLNLFQNIIIKTMIKNYESKIFKKMQFFINEPNFLYLIE